MALSYETLASLPSNAALAQRVKVRLALSAQYFLIEPQNTPNYELRRALAISQALSPDPGPWWWWILTDSGIYSLNNISEITDALLEAVIGAHWDHVAGVLPQGPAS